MKLYDKLAKEYDIRQENPSTRHLRKWEKKIIKKYVHGRILDIGCGTGYHLNFLKYIKKHAIGIDISKQMLLTSNLNNIIVADARNLPFLPKTFDTVLCMFSTLNLLNEKSVEEISRVLKNKGHLILSVSSIWDKKCPNLIKKLKTKNIDNHMKRKTVHIDKQILNFRLFTKPELIKLLERHNLELREFYGIFIYQRPYWGRFDRFSKKEQAKLWLDNLQLFKEAGCIYLAVFEKI